MPMPKPKMIIDEYSKPAQPAAASGSGGGGLFGFLGGGGQGGDNAPRLGLLGGEEGDFRDTLRRLGPALMMMDPMYANAGLAMAKMQADRAETRDKRKKANATAEWLGTQGVGEKEAAYLAANPTALNTWYTAWKQGQTPDWQFHEMTNADGRKQSAMVDMRTGNLKWLGNAAAPNVTIETTYDDQGNEQKVLFNHDTNEVVTKLGGSKSELLTPEELAQKKELAQAGASKTTIEMKGQGKEAETVGEGYGKFYIDTQAKGRNAVKSLGTLRLMEDAVKAEDFVSGTGSDFLLRMQQLGKTFGWDPAALTSMETFNTLSKQMVFDQIGSLGTGISEGDRRFIEDSLPGLGTSKGGNLAVIEIQRKLQQRNIEVAKQARDYRKANGEIDEGFDDILAEYSEKNPLFSDKDIADIRAKAAEVDKPKANAAGGDTFTAPGAGDEMIEVQPGVRVPRKLLPPDHPALQQSAPGGGDEMIEVQPGVRVPRRLLEQQQPVPVEPRTTPKGPRAPLPSRFGY